MSVAVAHSQTQAPSLTHRTRNAVRALAHRPLGVFLASLAAYTVTWGGHFTSGDGQIKLAWAESLLLRGASELPPGLGVTRSIYGIGHTLLAMPGLALSQAVQRATGVHCKAALYTFIFVLNGALFLYLVARYLWEAYAPRQVWTMSVLLGLASMWWPYTKVDFSEPLVLTFVFAGFLWVRRGRRVPGALVASFAFLIRQDSALLIAALALWDSWRSRDLKVLAIWAAAGLPWLGLEVASNLMRFGTAGVGSGYAREPFTNPFWVGVYGILFSAGKSVFLFSPPLVLGFLGWGRFRQRSGLGADAPFFLAVFLLQLAFYASWWDWSGDDSWGVRYMISGVMLMTLPAVELLSRRTWVVPLAAAGVAVQLLAVLISPLEYVVLVHQNRPERRLLYVDADVRRRIDFEDVRYNPSYSQLTAHWTLIRTKLGFPVAPRTPEDRVGTSVATALAADTLDVQWDFIWARRR